MNRFIRIKFIMFLLCVAFNLQASVGTCDSLGTMKDVINCALSNHPDVRSSEAEESVTESFEGIARQGVNPEFNSRSLWSSPSTGSVFNAEINLLHTFEAGSKRNARIGKAKSELNLSKLSTEKIRERVYLEILISLFRIRQFNTEIASVKDALATFTNMQKQYKGRVKLNPEQQANLRLFEIAESDYRMKLMGLELDYKSHIKLIESSIGSTFLPSMQNLPNKSISWPQLSNVIQKDFSSNSIVKIATEHLKLAQTNLTIAKSEAWPDFKIGPSFELQKNGVENITAYGVNITFPMPVYNQNNGQKLYSSLIIKKRELETQIIENELSRENEYLNEKYSSVTRLIKQMKSNTDIAKKHEEVENLFSQGLIPGSLLIEVHRQVYDFTISYNIQELAAVDSLARIYLLNGQFPLENLW